MKKITISEKCIKCGECAVMTDLIRELPDGTVEAAVSVLTSEQAAALDNVIKSCPAGAISLTDSGEGKFKSKNELLEYAKKNLGDYKFSTPQYESFNKNEFPISLPYSRSGYEYKSSDKAEREGLREFDRIMYSQRSTIARDVIQRFATSRMRPFYMYEKENGNYFYDNYKAIEKILQELAAAASELSGGKVQLPSDFTTFDVEPVWGISGDSFNRSLYILELRDMGEYGGQVTGEMLEFVDSLGDYQIYVNWDDMDVYNGRKDVTMYNYDLREVCQTLANDILSSVSSAISCNVREMIERSLANTLKPAKEALAQKMKAFENALSKI